MELKGRIALVTGAATGIGRATVLELTKAGVAGVAINYRTAKKKAEEVAAEARKRGAQALCVHADVKNDEEINGMIQQAAERFGRLDVLVNNAGITHWVPVSDLESTR